MKYIAIKDDWSTHPTWGFNFEKGKIYEIVNLHRLDGHSYHMYKLYGDRLELDVTKGYVENYFITLSKHRQIKLQKINGQKER